MITGEYLSSSHHFVSLLLSFLFISCSQCSQYSESTARSSATAYRGTTWINSIHTLDFLPSSFYADALVRPILLTPTILYNNLNLQFGCGFFCYGSPCDTGYQFATFFAIRDNNGKLLDMQMVWSSNREQMVQENATLALTSTGVVLRDADGTLIWSTNTSNHDFQGMMIQESGNLILFNMSSGIIWQSFDHPTDTALFGQKLKVGQKLTANTSPTNTSQVSLYYLQFDNVSVYFFTENGIAFQQIPIPRGSLSFKIDSSGHLQFCSILEVVLRSKIDYLSTFLGILDVCDYPALCGKFFFCTDGQCSCPIQGNAFYQIDATKPNLGCLPHRPLACSDTSISSNRAHGHHFLELEHVSYFTYRYNNPSIPQLVSRDYCQNLCLENCSCKAAFFRYGVNFSSGYCYLESNVYSLKMNNQSDVFYNSTAYIKVQSRSKQINYSVIVIIVAALLFLFVCTWISKYQKCRRKMDEDEDNRVDWPAGLPLRYSFQELQNATNDFSMKLGSGGFGSVYEGVLSDGSKIAVKRLDRARQGQKEFRVEVETLGKVDHLNLVRLKGFCADKAHQMLVYEHLPNGSLDKWIFSKKKHQNFLDWKTRYKVVLNIARGLAYLHEDCREQTIHFDIKPQNILLDQNFNAKVSDFGLAKLVNREQSEVITLLRGTPGYMAPELLNMHFTEKADVFSFGVMVVEILSGKRSRELSENGLFPLLPIKAEEGKLIDLIEEGLQDEQRSVSEEAVEVIKMGMWCVLEDFTRRPAMSTVVKVLEGLREVASDVPFAFAVSSVARNQQSLYSANPNPNRNLCLSPAPKPLVLSGPR
ncbi:G-type lectin S-receptor-like serine/threonine-protein kinase SD2-5 [Cryptomeria japonica]|uniref:G-type lectin S-receptor-like serine/threonine-protein kinase SD2-5 n=1 Tax=Cryptomeria japonica TaxID=3369 RepID=UPI0027DAA318|nr:G-type lectin S-receptor-like serine/threonine-protein kinase SD2-5 [Cryptomeria japonica]